MGARQTGSPGAWTITCDVDGCGAMYEGAPGEPLALVAIRAVLIGWHRAELIHANAFTCGAHTDPLAELLAAEAMEEAA